MDQDDLEDEIFAKTIWTHLKMLSKFMIQNKKGLIIFFSSVATIINEVGTSSSGAHIIAAQTDEILDGGTTVVLGSITYPGLATSAATNGLVAITQDGTTHAISAQYTASARTIYCNITNTTDATTQGAFSFVFEYIQFS